MERLMLFVFLCLFTICACHIFHEIREEREKVRESIANLTSKEREESLVEMVAYNNLELKNAQQKAKVELKNAQQKAKVELKNAQQKAKVELKNAQQEAKDYFNRTVQAEQQNERLMDLCIYLQCAANIRENMAQLSTRFMDHHEKNRRENINDGIGLTVKSRIDELFAIVKLLALQMPSRNNESELVVSPERPSKIEQQWSKLKNMKISFPNETNLEINIGELEIRILELNNAPNFEEAFELWKENDLFWRQLVANWSLRAEKSQPDFSRIPKKDQSSIENLTANSMLALEDMLYKNCKFDTIGEKQYATLLLAKYGKERKLPSHLTQLYKDIAWVLINSYKNDLVIKRMFEIFQERKDVMEFFKGIEKELIPGDDFLNTVDLYGSKYDRLDQMNSLLPFHRVSNGMKETCPVSDKDYDLYARNLAKQDKVFRSVVYSLMNVKIESKKDFSHERV